MSKLRIATVIAVLSLLAFTGCDGDLVPTTTVAETTTTVAETTTTVAEDTTTVPDDGGEGSGGAEADEEAPWWVLVLAGLALLVVIVAVARRGSKQKAAGVVPSKVTWKDNARSGYASARWLYDAMSEDVAIWRGNAQFDGTTDVGASAGTGRAESWSGMHDKLASASDALYQLEATAPDPRSAQAARTTIVTMRATREAMDARAEARYAYRRTEAEGADQSTLLGARDREVRASRNLTEARIAYGKALTDLSTLV